MQSLDAAQVKMETIQEKTYNDRVWNLIQMVANSSASIR